MPSVEISAFRFGNAFKRPNRRFGEKRHEAEFYLVVFLERLSAFLAQGHDRAQVRFVKGRQHGGGVLRDFQRRGNRLAAARHRQPFHPLVILWRGVGQNRRTGEDGRRGFHFRRGDGRGNGGFGGFRGSLLQIRGHILLHDFAMRPAARDLRNVHALHFRDALRNRRSGRFRRGSGRNGRDGGRGNNRRGGFDFGGAAIRRRQRGTVPGRRNNRQQIVNGNGIALFRNNLLHRSGGTGGNLDIYLVGFQLHHDLIRAHRFADLLQNPRDCRFHHRFA